jgi:rhomboid protease GluP
MRGDRSWAAVADRILESPLTWLITALNLGVFIIAWMDTKHEGWTLSGAGLLSYGAMERGHIWRGDYWRLLTCVFLHVGWIHLLWNTYGMFGWCADMEKAVGSGWFAFGYLTTGVGASAVSVLGHPAFGAGASGAGFGMIGMLLSMLYRREGSWDAFIRSPHVRNILVNTGIWVLIGMSGVMRMDNYAHLGGFAFGILCGLVVGRRRGRQERRWIVSLAAYILVWAGVVAAACVPGLGFGGMGD